MSICEICFIKDKLNICPKCSRNVCSFSIKFSVCDLCILIEMKFAFQYQQHNLQIEKQEYQLKQINEKLYTLNQEISLIQKANSLFNKNQNEKCQQLEFQMSQTIIDKQHELEDIETEIENQKFIIQMKNQMNYKYINQNYQLNIKSQIQKQMKLRKNIRCYKKFQIKKNNKYIKSYKL